METPEAEDFLDTKKSKKLNIVLIVLASIIGVVLLSFSAFALFFAKKTEKNHVYKKIDKKIIWNICKTNKKIEKIKIILTK